MSSQAGVAIPPRSHVEACIDRVARYLPHQGPLKDFIHHNTLQAFQEFPFHEGCLRASRTYGSRTYFSLPTYHRLRDQGGISVGALATIVRESTLDLAQELREQHPEESWEDVLRSERWGSYSPLPGIAEAGLRSRWRTVHGRRLDHRIHAKLFRLLGQHLDQGISMWGAPHPECTLFDFVRRLVADSWLPLRPWSLPRTRPFLALPPAEVVDTILRRLLGPGTEAFYERYLLEMCLDHPGWSGMIRELECHPEHLLEPKRVSLLELCALELMAEHAYLSLDLGENFPTLLGPGQPKPSPLPYDPDYQVRMSPAEQVAQIWHQAFERTYRDQFLVRLQQHRRSRPLDPDRDRVPKAQVFFCLDDREGSLRRHLEDQDPLWETFGFAGFFGVDCVFQGVDDVFPSKHCPAPINPKHRIREYGVSPRREPGSLQIGEVHEHSHTLVRGFVISQTLGLSAALKLAVSIFRPSLNPLATSSLHRVNTASALAIHRTSEELDEGFLSGYSDVEMADRVERVMKASGLAAAPLSRLVLFVGHGSSSINNPYFAAYDCGACAGRGGGPNARAVALMANRPQVRGLLRSRGIEIPDACWFVGALHDTTRDEMQFYDLGSLPSSHQPLLEELRNALEQAVALNAKERCQRFANVPSKIDPRDAILAVRRRSVSIFEPRPELNHATNAAFILGRRWLTKGLCLNRRCFLASYDPTVDSDGEILASLLSAAVPVCAGINLEYYFSRLDPRVYGSGSKLPHNIQGLIGVINGTEGDLLTGLPTQMTEVHDPIRLLLLVEQRPEVALKAALASQEVASLVSNGWIQYLSWDYTQGDFYEYAEGAMHILPSGSDSPTT